MYIYIYKYILSTIIKIIDFPPNNFLMIVGTPAITLHLAFVSQFEYQIDRTQPGATILDTVGLASMAMKGYPHYLKL